MSRDRFRQFSTDMINFSGQDAWEATPRGGEKKKPGLSVGLATSEHDLDCFIGFVTELRDHSVNSLAPLLRPCRTVEEGEQTG